ncbi:gamma-aminobutyrate permease [Boudabousia marimammalium]|uniref:Gamma-aminobutyrate permease n=1 Tax=Boudabousia marimammalium TaxID=156892 RepID=A0A1Q5PSK3_9ACTO|nr:gamma-aminobutyrate permease [Boudabousia marimammalium]
MPGENSDNNQTAPSGNRLERGLRARHLMMIAIGGAIGTGLFVASGATISQAGPGGALLAYTVIGAMVFLLMQSLGEMAAYIPVAGSFQTYASRFVSPSFGFAIGWNYWFNWAITVAAELVAAALVMRYWLPEVPSWIWSAIFLAILFVLNYLSARAFGEGEFWFAAIKVVTVIVFLIVGVAMILGILGGSSPGFSNWTLEEAPFVNGFGGILAVFMIAGFSFQGTELVGVAAGESEHPERDIPRAIHAVFWRIMLFYVGAIAVIGFLIPYTNPNLLDSDVSAIAISPFTIIFHKAGVLAAASVMNAVILTSILSAGNSGLYASTRMLYALAHEGIAPASFGKVNRRGVPVNALLATTAVGAFCFLTSLIGTGSAYTWLVNISGLSGFIAWLGIAWSHYRFRKAFLAQGHTLDELPFAARFFPFGPIAALALCSIVVIGQNYEALFVTFDVWGIISSYLTIPIFAALWIGHRMVSGTGFVKATEADLSRESKLRF